MMQIAMQGWQCPGCKTVYAPHITSCRCQTAPFGSPFPSSPSIAPPHFPFAPPTIVSMANGITGFATIGAPKPGVYDDAMGNTAGVIRGGGGGEPIENANNRLLVVKNHCNCECGGGCSC